MNVYERLGVRRVINAYGNVTTLGGSLMEAETVQAMAEASGWFVDLGDLLEKAGARLAGLIGVEGAFITSGAAAGLLVSTAACVAGSDETKIRQLPDLSGMKNEVIVQRCQRNIWDQAVRTAGVTLVEIGLDAPATPDELRRAIGERTAAVIYFVDHDEDHSLPLPDVIGVAKARGVPVLVDAAAELPPVANLRRFYDLGADLTIFSGGKMLRGPQSSGLILGRKALIDACARNASPNLGIGRPLKVGKEEIVGLVTAVERFLRHDFETDMARWEAQVAYCLSVFGRLGGVDAARIFPGQDDVLPRDVPRIYLNWDARYAVSPDALAAELLDGEPSIGMGTFRGGLVVNPIELREGEEAIVARRIVEALQAHERAAKG